MLFFVATGIPALPPSDAVSPVRRASRFSRGRRVSYGRQSSGSPPPDGAEPAPAFTTWDASSEGLQVGSGGTGPAGKKNCVGLKYIGRLTDGLGEEMIEIYLGSFHQQALIAEAKRVLSQPQNRGLGMELAAGVAAMGVGRNSIGAVVTTSRPYKKVRPSPGSSHLRRVNRPARLLAVSQGCRRMYEQNASVAYHRKPHMHHCIQLSHATYYAGDPGNVFERHGERVPRP